MKATLIKTVAVASLFLLGAATLKSQTPAAFRPRDPLDDTSRTAFRSYSLRAAAEAQTRAKVAKAERRVPKKEQAVSEWKRTVDYSGPRFGFTYLPAEVVDSLKNHDIDVGQTISQFGWQLEHEIHVTPEGPMVLNEWVFLAGGLEKGVFLPSVTWLVGARGRSGNEVGFGPNVSVAGVGLALAAGVNVNSGGLHFPMNVAAASSKGGIRVSFLTGFTLH
jgi:hypothetical protein